MQLEILGKEISTDDKGRFSLNDLHRAAGGAVKHQPAQFFRLDSTSEMVAALNMANPIVEPISRKAGRYGGSWVCKEMVYEYAMWISAEFRLAVIRAFDSLASDNQTQRSMIALNDLVKKIESDRDVASVCGRELASYRKIKKENQERFDEIVKSTQLTLGFK